MLKYSLKLKRSGSSGIRTHASEETGALIQRLRPLGHATRRQEPKSRLYKLKRNAIYLLTLQALIKTTS